MPGATMTARVGLLRKCLIENGRLRYAAAIMTTDIPEGGLVLTKLFVKLNDLISTNKS